jgi:hypothetical protein
MNPLNKPNIHVSNLHTYYAMSKGNIIGMNLLNKPNIHVSNLRTYYAMSRGNIIGMNPLNKPNIHVSNLHTYYAMSRGNIIEMNPLNKPNIHVSNLHTCYAISRGLMLYLAQDKITLVVAICGHVIVAIVPTKVFYVCNLHFKSYMGHTMNPTPANSIIVIQGILSTILPFSLL